MKILCYGTYVVGFETMVIMDLWGITFHAVVVIVLALTLLFSSISTNSGSGLALSLGVLGLENPKKVKNSTLLLMVIL